MRKLLVIGLVVVLSGCSVRFAYNWLDWIIPWQIDDYVDLNKSQSKQLDKLINKTLVWHRIHEIPYYLEHIDSLSADLQLPMKPEQIAQQIERFSQHWSRLYDHLIPDIIPLIQTLSDKQVAQIIEQVDEDEQELREEYDELSLEERIAKSNKQMLKGLKKRIGKLSDEQKQLVKSYNDQRHRSLTVWFSYRDRYIEILKLGLEQRADSKLLRQHLQILLIDYDQLKSPEHVELIRFNRQLMWNLLAEVQHSLSDKQQDKLIKQLRELREDFAYIANDA